MYPILHLFGQEVPSYGFMLIIAFAAAFIVAMLRHKINGISKLDTLVAMLLAGVGAFLGGKLFYAIQGLPQFFELQARLNINFLDYLTQYAGLVYYGSFIGCVLMLLLFCVLYKISFWKMIDALLPSLPLAQAIGRVGCFMAGCCYGMPFEHGFVIHSADLAQHDAVHSIAGLAPRDVPLLPVQLIEASCVLALFFIMVYYGRQTRPPGKVFSIYLIGYGAIRFILEFFRYDAIRGFAGGLSISQWVSIILITLGLYFAIFYRPRKKASLPHSPV